MGITIHNNLKGRNREHEKVREFIIRGLPKETCGNCGYPNCAGMPHGKKCGNWIPMSKE